MLYLGFVLTRDPAMLSFWTRWSSSPLWEECGFSGRPVYQTLTERFLEIEEEFDDAFIDVARLMIEQAQRHDPLIGRYWHCDATPFLVNARVHHECLDKAACQALQKKHGRAAKTLALTEQGKLQEFRHAEQAAELMPEEDALDAEPVATPVTIVSATMESAGVPVDTETSDAADEETSPFDAKLIGDDLEVVTPRSDLEGAQLAVTTQTGHRYVSRDASAGLRIYQTRPDKNGKREIKAIWFGGLSMLAHDNRAGGVLGAHAIAANNQEAKEYPALYEKARRLAGDDPLAMTGDKAYAFKAIYEHNTRHRVATVVPFRSRQGAKKRVTTRTDQVDEYGVPRCAHCGGPGDQFSSGLGVVRDKQGVWRLRFRCKLVLLAECDSVQSIKCETDWRLLQTINLTAPVYHDLREAHGQFERNNGFLRKRYGASGKDGSSRLCRIGVQTQQTRLNAAILLDWFRINLNQGWLGSARGKRNHQPPTPYTGRPRFLAVIRARERRRLNGPIGTQRDQLDMNKVRLALKVRLATGRGGRLFRSDVLKPPEPDPDPF